MGSRVRELDGVRGIAILMVVVWHYIACQIHAPVDGSLAYYAKAGLWLGWSGVELFFVLSGFLVTAGLVAHRGEPGFLRAFAGRRAHRILPPYVLLLATFIVATYAGLPGFSGTGRLAGVVAYPMPLWSYLTFTQNIAMGLRGGYGAPWMGVTWMLAVEVQFYVLIALAVWAVSLRRLTWLLVLALVAAPVLRAACPGPLASLLLPTRGDGLAAGALLACLRGGVPVPRIVARGRRLLPWLLAVLAVGTGLLTWRPAALGVFRGTWLAMLYASLVGTAVCYRGARGLAPLRWGGLAFMGRISYALFLVHQLVSGILHGVFRAGAEPSLETPGGWAVTLAAAAVSVGLATLSLHTIERGVSGSGRERGVATSSAGRGA